MPRSYAPSPPPKYDSRNYIVAYSSLSKNRENRVRPSDTDDPARVKVIADCLARLKAPCAAG